MFETEICPHPSCALGIFAVPRSIAPLILAALIKEAAGVEIPISSRMNSRINETEPPATAVAWLEPESDIYMSLPFKCVPLPQLKPTGIAASSALPEQMETPGATKSGFTRPSNDGPFAEKLATLPDGLVVDAPIESTFLAVDGAITLEAF